MQVGIIIRGGGLICGRLPGPSLRRGAYEWNFLGLSRGLAVKNLDANTGSVIRETSLF